MKKLALILVFVGGLFGADVVSEFELDKIFDSPEAQDIMQDSKIAFIFGENKGATIIQKDLLSHKKTSKKKGNKKFNNSVSGKNYNWYENEKSCGWALLAAIKQYIKTANENGASKVVNIYFSWDNKKYKSSQTYACAVGKAFAAVKMHADLAK